MSSYSQAALDAIADRLNNRPRAVLVWRTPAEAFAEAHWNDGWDVP